MSELHGQLVIGDILPIEETGNRAMAEGYDAEGHLMDYEPQTPAEMGDTSSVTADAVTPSPQGEGYVDLPTAGEAERLTAIAAEVRTIEEQVKGAALSGAVAIGRRLIEAKELVPRGRFGEWLAANLSYSERRAQDLMRLYETYGRETIPASVSALDYSKAVALLSAPEEEREALAARAVEEDMSVRRLQEEVKRLNIEKAKAQITIEDLEGKVQGQIEEIHRLDEREQKYDAAIARMEQDVSAMRGTVEAAEQTAEALRKEKAAAKEAADLAARRAGDAVERANETAKQLAEARTRIEELENREPERVEVVPEAVAAELERLRGQKPRGEAEVRFRLAFERLGAEFKAVTAILAEVNQEDADKGARFASAVAGACRKMIGMLGEEG